MFYIGGLTESFSFHQTTKFETFTQTHSVSVRFCCAFLWVLSSGSMGKHDFSSHADKKNLIVSVLKISVSAVCLFGQWQQECWLCLCQNIKVIQTSFAISKYKYSLCVSPDGGARFMMEIRSACLSSSEWADLTRYSWLYLQPLVSELEMFVIEANVCRNAAISSLCSQPCNTRWDT